MCRRHPLRLAATALVVALAVALAAASSAAAAAPKISGADSDIWNVAAPTPAYTVTGSVRGAIISWTLSGTTKKGSGASPLRVTLSGLTTGNYTLEASEAGMSGKARRAVKVDVTPPTLVIRQPTAGAVYQPGQSVTVDFSCSGAATCVGTVADGEPLPTATGGAGTLVVTATDSGRNVVTQSVAYTVGPVAPTITARPPQPVRGNRPSFGWTGGEPGAVFTWEVLSGGTVISQGDTIVPAVTLGPLTPGSYAFQVRQTVDSGRVSAASVADPFTVVDSPPTIARIVPPVLSPRRLRPGPGATITSPRPLLAWRRVAGARLYNLQVFEVRGTSLTKVSSTFPRGNRARAKGLRFGMRYAWRVWPYVRGSYPARPLGLSYFDLVRPVRLDATQMLVNRRIAEAAVRRVNAIERWLDAGLTAGDLRHAGLGAAAFDPALKPTGVPSSDGTAAAAARPIGTGGKPAAGRRRIRVSAAELLRTQRIAQSAVRRIDGLEARLRAGLTGGDIVDGSIGLEKLAAGVSLGAPTATGAPAARTATVVASPRRGRAVRVRLSPAQLLVSQAISQGAVRRAEALRQRLLWGLSTDDFRPGSIGAADLEPVVRR